MKQLSFKKIFIAFLIIFLLSRSRKIIDYLSAIKLGEWFTLEPLNKSPLLGRYIVTVLLLMLIYVTIIKIYIKRK